MAEPQFGGPWTEEKLSRLRKYLRAYMTIFSTHPQAKLLKTIYVDAFAGAGFRSRIPTGHSPRRTTFTPITPKRLLISLVCHRQTWLWSIWRERRRLSKPGRKLDAATQDGSREFWA